MWADAKRAWDYLAGAARLLRRNPSLLLLPLAVVVFNAVEGTAGGQIMVRHTGLGKAMLQKVRKTPGPKVDGRPLVVESWYHLAAAGVAGVTLSGTGSLVVAGVLGTAAIEPPDRRGTMHMWLLEVLAGLSVVGAVNGLTRGGYYGLACTTVASGEASWRKFGHYARRFFLRFWMLFALFVLAGYGLLWASGLAPGGPGTGRVGWLAYTWSGRAIAFLLVLSSCAVVSDDCGVLSSLRKSVVIMVRGFIMTLLLLGAFSLLEHYLVLAFAWLRSWVWRSNATYDLTRAYWPGRAVDLGQHSVLIAVGTLFLLAVLLWYREASAKLWPVRAAEAAGTADESG
jgi:hypothetical protein